jgi:hypothetical protein
MSHDSQQTTGVQAEKSASGLDPSGPMWTAAVVLIAFVVQWGLYDRVLVPMDEGHLAAAASWMLDGKLLYRDIHTGIFPGIYLLTTLLFALFGEDLLVMRVAALAMNLTISLSLWRIATRFARPHAALLAPLFHLCVWVVGFPVLAMFNYSTLAICFSLLALLFVLRYLERGRMPDALAIGLLVAAATLTKQNFGALTFVALLGVLLTNRAGSGAQGLGTVRLLAPIAAAGAMATALVATWFLATGTLFDLIDATVLSLGGSQLQDFNNPIPPIFGPHPSDDGRFLFLYLPPFVFNYLIHGESMQGVEFAPWLREMTIRLSYGLTILAVLISPIVLYLTRTWGTPGQQRAARGAVVFAVVFFPAIFPSAIWSHLAFVLVPTGLLTSFLAERAERALERSGERRRGLLLALRAAGALVVLLMAALCLRVSLDTARWNDVALGIERANVRVSERIAGLMRGSLEFVEACADPDEPILAVPDIPIVYFITDRPNPSPFDLTIPGQVDGRLIERQLVAQDVRCIVYNPQMYPEFPPMAQLFPDLFRFIQVEFEGERVIRGGDTEWAGLVRRERR